MVLETPVLIREVLEPSSFSLCRSLDGIAVQVDHTGDLKTFPLKHICREGSLENAVSAVGSREISHLKLPVFANSDDCNIIVCS
jgi:hypothetical protein